MNQPNKKFKLRENTFARNSEVYCEKCGFHRFGRSKMMLVSNIAMVVSGIAASYSVNLTMLIITRLVLGIFTAGVRNAAYANGMVVIFKKSSLSMACYNVLTCNQKYMVDRNLSTPTTSKLYL